ncbi:hypothetical protein PVL30_005200 [Lodderomyces elongisporus]|uniref:uncharacterized protein n=1 Tax=Lodderomyces elongisporus TaxID=36914 RepID=UPI00291CFB2A|nr:uncharacterized protein PVL30_005200 [Lodderomyces elongisporus]WLF81403.1 hypothetical protein PVL30_005200 [Lodderomyces elongisporus]
MPSTAAATTTTPTPTPKTRSTSRPGVTNKADNEWARAELDVIKEQQQQEKIVNEEFKIWKKTVPLLYDLIHTFALPEVSTVVQWIPEYKKSNGNGNFTETTFLLASNCVNKADNCVQLGSVKLPSTIVEKGKEIPVPTEGSETADFKILNKWKQANEVYKLKVAPDGANALSFNSDGVIHRFDLLNKSVSDYKYHKQGGYALEWIDNSRFLSGSKDSQIALWQLDKPSTPIQLFKSHYGAINDISASDENIFGSVSDDSTTQFYDIRLSSSDNSSASMSSANPYIKIENKHIQNSIKFHPNIKTLYATGGKDNIVSLYDLRNNKEPIRKFYGHNDSIKQLEWDWTNPSILASTGYDNRVLFWNLENLDEEYSYPDSSTPTSTEAPRRRNTQVVKIDPCLKFVHGGHTDRVNDFAIHPKIKNLFATVGDDKLLEIWKPKSLPVEDVDEEEEAEEEEEEEQEEQEEAEEEIKREEAEGIEGSEAEEKEEEGKVGKENEGKEEEEEEDKEKKVEDIEKDEKEVTKQEDESKPSEEKRKDEEVKDGTEGKEEIKEDVEMKEEGEKPSETEKQEDADVEMKDVSEEPRNNDDNTMNEEPKESSSKDLKADTKGENNGSTISADEPSAAADDMELDEEKKGISIEKEGAAETKKDSSATPDVDTISGNN